MKVEIQAVHFQADSELKEFIEKKVEKLETYFDRIIESKVTLSLEKNGTQVKNKIAVIKLSIPGTMLISKETSKLFEESVDMAVDSLRRQLKKHKSKVNQHA
ncbi:MAG: ribosome-associated translation inhibitor RaiA [Bacteroidetes bacterium]|nr:ribosome-associated translation inhibitor RaiA [Bacteroidota bacterium]